MSVSILATSEARAFSSRMVSGVGTAVAASLRSIWARRARICSMSSAGALMITDCVPYSGAMVTCSAAGARGPLLNVVVRAWAV